MDCEGSIADCVLHPPPSCVQLQDCLMFAQIHQDLNPPSLAPQLPSGPTAL